MLIFVRSIITCFGICLIWPISCLAGADTPKNNEKSKSPSISSNLENNTTLPPSDADTQKASPQSDNKQYFFEGTSNPLMNSTFNYLDKVQNWVGGYVEDLGESADAFFGTDEDFDRTQGSRLDIMTPLTIHANGKVDTRVKFRAKVALPRTNKRWNMIVQSAENSIQDYANASSDANVSGNTAATATANNDTATAVGLRYMLEVKDYTSSFIGFGWNFRGISPDPYARIKGTYKWQLSDKIYSRMVQDLFWESSAGVGLTSKQIFDYQFNHENLFRSETQGTWWDKEQFYELHQTFYFYQTMNVHRAVAYHVGWDWDTKDVGPHLTSYHVGFNWRERIYKKWLFFEIQPRVDFSQDTNFRQADPNITFMFEAQFYDRKFEK